MNKTKSRYPSWWAYYHLARNAYFLLGIPCLLLYSAAYTSDLLDDNLRHSISLFILVDWPPESPDNQYHLNK